VRNGGAILAWANFAARAMRAGLIGFSRQGPQLFRKRQRTGAVQDLPELGQLSHALRVLDTSAAVLYRFSTPALCVKSIGSRTKLEALWRRFCRRDAMSKIVLITGTDTGVGKTVLTALLLRHLREEGRDALAMKPFCSGGRKDARVLHGFQKQCLTLGEVNPFHFRQPLAPWIAARNEGRRVAFSSVKNRIRALGDRCEILLVEGAGGVLSPLGPGYSAADLAAAFHCPVIVVARNRLGMINHTLLTVRHLQLLGVERLSVALMDFGKRDLSSRTNARALGDLLRGVAIFRVPDLGFERNSTSGIKKGEKKLKKLLHDISAVVI
jgi:dethiobiotin synthetase